LKWALTRAVHFDHLIQAKTGTDEDLKTVMEVNKELYDFNSNDHTQED